MGPDAWPFISNECGATAQSPIDIITESAISDNTLTDIKFNNYDQNIKFKLTVDSFTGKSISLTIIINHLIIKKLFKLHMVY